MVKKSGDVAMRKTTIRLPEDIWRAARIKALDEDRDFQDIVADALRDYLKKRPTRRKKSG